MQFKTLFSVGLAALLFAACGDKTNSNTDKPSGDTTVTKTELKVKTTPEDGKIAAADALMQKVDAAKGEQKVENRYYAGEGHDYFRYIVYSEGDKMVKVTEGSGEGPYVAYFTYYFQDDKIFLKHKAVSYDELPFIDSKTYFEEGKPFAFVGKSKKEDDMATDLTSLKMERKELAVGIPNMDEYMQYLDAMLKRLAASKVEK